MLKWAWLTYVMLNCLAQGQEMQRYFSTPSYYRLFHDLEAKIWILINRVPELSWKKVVIPPAKHHVSALPSVILVHGKFNKFGKGKRLLIVNDVHVQVSEQGDFVLRVLTKGTEFGLQVSLRDLDSHNNVEQTIGMGVYTASAPPQHLSSPSDFSGFLASQVFSQRKLASLELAPSSETEERLDDFGIYLGASLSNYEQQSIYRLSPVTSYIRLTYERNLESLVNGPLVLGLASRLSVFSLANNTLASLQVINPEIYGGVILFKQNTIQLKFLGGASYLTSFGSSDLGFYSLLGPTIQLAAQWSFLPDWNLIGFAKLTQLPGVTGSSFLSSRDVTSGVGIEKNYWGVFSEWQTLRLQQTS
ncbi:MAG: hypothetical protein EBQ85_04630, partial [Proteobacteria bacterium]|nr:hypothetical protein [Pseudomonadota bacterium]